MNSNTKIIYDNGMRQMTFSKSGTIWITTLSGFSSNNITISETQATGQTGTTLSGQAIQPKDITIDGVIRGDIAANRRALLATVSPGIPARITVVQGNKSYYLEGVPTKTPEISDGMSEQDFQFAFHSPYPYWQDTDHVNSTVSGLAALFRFPFYTGGEWYISKYSEGYYGEVINEGDMAVGFVVSFYASAQVSNPEILHMGTGKKIRLNIDLAAGDRIIVSTVYGQKRVTVLYSDGNAENGFRYLSMDSGLDMEILPGKNLIRHDADEGHSNLAITISAPRGVVSGV